MRYRKSRVIYVVLVAVIFGLFLQDCDIFGPPVAVQAGSWSGTITHSSYVALSFTVNDRTISGKTTVEFPFSNATVVEYTYDDIQIAKDGTFSYSRGSVSSSGGKITLSGTFSGSECTGQASYDEDSSFASGHLSYDWKGTPD